MGNHSKHLQTKGRNEKQVSQPKGKVAMMLLILYSDITSFAI